MKLLIVSDLHLEFGNTYVPPQTGYDVAVIAGDIGNPATFVVHWAKRESTFRCARNVVYVPGNHEFYGTVMQRSLAAMREAAVGSKVHALECAETVIDDVRFLGCVLWTDFALRVETSIGEYSHVPRSLSTARKRLSDYRVIRIEETAQEIVEAAGRYIPDPDTRREVRRLQPEDTLALHQAHRQWLWTKLNEPFDGPTVVVTHHAPHRNSLAHVYATDWLSGSFVSELPYEFFKVPVLWVHGHTHTSFSYRIGSCRVVCNPRGYLLGRDRRTPENPKFDPALVIEI